MALVAACGGDPPSAPTPRLTNITVTGSDLLLVGNSETFIAMGNAGVLTAPRWGSDAPTVATVNADTGQVMVVGTGTATIFVDANGLRGTKLIRTLPNFAGEWSGRYRVIACKSPGLRSGCSERSTTDTYNVSFSLTQNRDRVLGSLGYDGDGSIPVYFGAVSPDGVLSLTGAGMYTFFGYLDNLRFESTQAGQLTGTFEEVWPGVTGGDEVRFVFQLVGVSRK